MKKLMFILLFGSLGAVSSQAATIVKGNCTSCSRTGGVTTVVCDTDPAIT